MNDLFCGFLNVFDALSDAAGEVFPNLDCGDGTGNPVIALPLTILFLIIAIFTR